MADKKGGAPEAPDYTPIAKMANKASKRAFKLGNKQFNWAKKQQKKNNKLTKKVTKNLLNIMNEQADNAREDRQRYEDVFLPLQDEYLGNIDEFQGKADDFSAEVAKLKADAEEYGSDANKSFMMGRAKSSVGQSFEAARRNNLQMLEGYGVNPSATRYAALDLGVRTAEAAAKAAAGTEASLNVDETSRAMYQDALDRELQARGLDREVLGMKENMINIGQGFPAQVGGAYGQSTDAGNSAVTDRLNTSQVNRGNRTSFNDFLASMNQSLGSWTDALNSGFQNQLDSYNAEQQSSSGIGSILGTGLGAITSFFEEGGEVDPALSPSGGAITDDVPAMVDAGEFIFPDEVVRYYGTKHLQKMMDTAHQAMAIPED